LRPLWTLRALTPATCRSRDPDLLADGGHAIFTAVIPVALG